MKIDDRSSARSSRSAAARETDPTNKALFHSLLLTKGFAVATVFHLGLVPHYIYLAMFRNQYDTDVTVWSPEGRLLQVSEKIAGSAPQHYSRL